MGRWITPTLLTTFSACALGAACIDVATFVAGQETGQDIALDTSMPDARPDGADDAGPTTDSETDAPCVADCSDRSCGDDGCGGRCGEGCATELVCDQESGTCAIIPGNACNSPLLIDELPFSTDGDTARQARPTFSFTGGACSGAGDDVGLASNDNVYALLVRTTGVYTITLEADFDSALYVIDTCEPAVSPGSCLGVSDLRGSGAESLVLPLVADQTYYLVVDGFSNSDNVAGPYTLRVEEACLPMCDGRDCGADGCGSSCGQCSGDQVCDTKGACVLTPGNGCGLPFTIDGDTLPATVAADTTVDATSTFTTPGACAGLDASVGAASNDHVYAFTPRVTGVYTLTLTAQFDAVVSVRDGCGEGKCLAGDTRLGADEVISVLLTSQTAYYIVVDGFANDANDAGAYELVLSEPCIPDCLGRVCGGDGCGLSCGTCLAPSVCDGGACIDPGQLIGNTCSNPFVVDALPWTASEDTSLGSDEVSLSADRCDEGNPPLGVGSPDHVYRFTAPAAGTFIIELQADFVAALYAVPNCVAGMPEGCLARGFGDLSETLAVTAQQGQQVGVVVDGVSPAVEDRGSYTLSISDVCIADCAQKACGSDGCLGSCGSCDAALVCDAGQCVDPTTVSGNRCANPIEVGTLPFEDSGTTSHRSADFAISPGDCPDLVGGFGADSRDVVYAFTPPAPGSYLISLSADFDSTLYVQAQCGVGDSCEGADDAIGAATERVQLTLSDTAPRYIIVDGFSNSGDISGAYTLRVEAL